MLRLVLVAAVVIVAGADPIIPPNGLEIVGGRPGDITEVPYQISLENNGVHDCGGSILSSTRILTAAHCTNGRHPSIMTVRAGSSTRESGGQVSRVSRVYQHPRYAAPDYDVAVLILAEPLRLGPGVQPIALQPAGQEIPDGTSGVISGWGRLYWQGPLSKNLQIAQVPKSNDAQCQNAYDVNITPRMTCYGYQKGGINTCQGDSGGALVVNGRQVGIVSFANNGCADPGVPTVFVKVSNSEINQYINNSV